MSGVLSLEPFSAIQCLPTAFFGETDLEASLQPLGIHRFKGEDNIEEAFLTTELNSPLYLKNL